MKVKSILAVSLLAAGAACADTTEVDTDYVLGVMPVTANGKTQVILSVPWVAEGVGNATTIAVTNLVKTAGLAVGDQLTWYDTSKSQYKAWRVVAGDGGVKYWVPTTIVVREEEFEAPADGASLKRGEAIVLTRTGTSDTIYVVGQVGTSSTVSTEIPAGECWVILAPPRAAITDVDLNSCASVTEEGGWSNCVGDEIVVDAANGLLKTYKCVDRGESANTTTYPRYVWTTSKYAATHTAMIPAGRGFWYHRSASNTGAVTITWSGVPSSAN